jgi:predicted PurR-regulated permease PerM
MGFTGVDIPTFDELQASVGDGGFISERLGRITDITLGVLETILILILGPVVAYVLLDLPTMPQDDGLIPGGIAEVVHVSRQLGTAVGGFLRGQLFRGADRGVMTSVGFWLVGLPFWLLIGMIASSQHHPLRRPMGRWDPRHTRGSRHP